MLWQLLGADRRRKALLKKTQAGPLRDYYATPFVDLKTPIQQCEIVALDFETTGLDPQTDHIVSVGMVTIHGLSIALNTAQHNIIYTPQTISEQSAVLHHITDDIMQQGKSIKTTLTHLLTQLSGRVLLVHHANVEQRFLSRLCQYFYQQPFYIPTIDTEVLAKRQLTREQITLKHGDLRLFNLRRRYALPEYKAHNAFYDALGTAELFLALLSRLSPKLDCRLKDLACH